MVWLWTWIYIDETGMPWDSGSLVLGARCWPDASAKLLELCSSWGTAPSPHEQPHAAVLCTAVHCHMSRHVGDSPMRRGGITAIHLHKPCSCWGCSVGREGAKEPVPAPCCLVLTAETGLGIWAAWQPAYHVSGRIIKCYH